MAPSILLAHPDPRTQRTVQRVLGGTGYQLDVVDDLAHGMAVLESEPPVLAVADGSALASPHVETFFAAVAAHGAEGCMLLLDPDHFALVPRVLGLEVTSLLVHPMPVLGEELAITAQKLVRGDLFGAEKYLLWGTALRPTTMTRSTQRPHIVGELAAAIRAGGQSARVAAMAMLVADELLSNAVHNAPIDDRGHYRAELPRDADLPLDGRHQVDLRWGCDGRYLAIEVADRFGSLARDTVLRSLVHRDVRTSGSGAGMGIALTYRSCDHLVFNLAPGNRTEVIALIDVRNPHGERVPAASYNVFVERAARTPEDS